MTSRRAPSPEDAPKLVPALERATFRAEAPIRKVVRSNRLNPLPYAGTISVFLLIVVIATGVYITLFFSFGFDASYRSVDRMHDHPIQSVVRTLHRYSSAALVLTTLVHAWRIFVAGRFRGPRRWRWATGVTSLLIVWLAGVTGYWLVWDERAQALNEATMSLFGRIGWVSSFYVDNVASPAAGSGWGVLFAMWTVHLALTAVIGYFLWRHLRRSRLANLPPRHWMAIMFGALLIAAIAFPAELLDPADQARLVGDLPLDPFVMFLLPPLLSSWAWLAALVGVALVVVVMVAPWRAETAPIVEIDPDACTGCELCVVDCPYLALTMQTVTASDEHDGTQARRPIAVVDPDACVGCGICIGSCSFGAMDLPGFSSTDAVDPSGKHVVLACQRHLAAAGGSEAVTNRAGGDTRMDAVMVVEVPCTGMIHANTVGALTLAGATQVQVVGCPPGDCAYGLGNTILDERLRGERAPHVARKYAGVASEDWVAPGELVDAVAHPNVHPEVDGSHWSSGRRVVGAVAIVLVSVVGVALATRAPYRSDDDHAGVLVVVSHTPGLQLEGQPTATGRLGDPVEVVTRSDGEELGRDQVPTSGDTAAGLVELSLDAGEHALQVSLVEGGAETLVYDGTVSLSDGQRLVVNAIDVPPPPGIDEGRKVFTDRSLGSCDVCHSTRPGDDRVGPSLAGVGERAATRVEGLDAEAYLRQSILDPDAYIVDGFRAGQMLDIYGDRLSPEQIESLIDYLMSLPGGGS
jgi:ferredoxin